MKDLLGFNEDGSRRPHMLGHFFLAIDVEHFVPLPAFRRIVGNMIRELHAAEKAPGEERVYVAGEKEYEKEKEIQEKGVPVNDNLRQDLQFMRDTLDVQGYETYF